MFSLVADNLAKRFGPRKVFTNISFELVTGQSLALVGNNGSGKTTLMLMLLGAIAPSRGTVVFRREQVDLEEEPIRRATALVSPYLNLYDQLTAEENLTFLTTVSGGHLTGKEINNLLKKVGLEGRGIDLVGSYSSGMKQRLKYAAALARRPAFLFLDEPTSNLDDAGKEIVRQVIDESRSESIVVIATNEKEEYSLADKLCRLND